MFQAETGTPVTDLPLQLAGTPLPACLLYGGYTLTQTVFPQKLSTSPLLILSRVHTFMCANRYPKPAIDSIYEAIVPREHNPATTLKDRARNDP